MVFRTADLAAGAERTVIDVEPPQHSTTPWTCLAELQSWAAFGVGSGDDATLVVMHLAQPVMPGHDPHAAPTMPVRCGAWHARSDRRAGPGWDALRPAPHRQLPHALTGPRRNGL
jgi:hypothetical protein